MFKFKNHKEMKKSITTLALLCAVLACQEVEAKDNKALLDDEQLGKINDRLKALEDGKAAAEQAKSEAEQAKAEAEAESKKAELQALVDKMPANPTATPGSDTHQEESYEDAWKKSDTYKEACEELGVEA
jgi:hypothetical protein